MERQDRSQAPGRLHDSLGQAQQGSPSQRGDFSRGGTTAQAWSLREGHRLGGTFVTSDPTMARGIAAIAASPCRWPSAHVEYPPGEAAIPLLAADRARKWRALWHLWLGRGT